MFFLGEIDNRPPRLEVSKKTPPVPPNLILHFSMFLAVLQVSNLPRQVRDILTFRLVQVSSNFNEI